MRTSSGFLVTGTSGNTRIQTRPARFYVARQCARAASIWRGHALRLERLQAVLAEGERGARRSRGP